MIKLVGYVAIPTFLLLVGLNGPFAQAQTPEVLLRLVPRECKDTADRVLTRLEKFRLAEKAATETFNKQLAICERQLKIQLGGLEKNKAQSQISEMKLWLKNGGDLPRCDALLDFTVQYVTALSKARMPLQAPYAALVKDVRRENQFQLADQLEAAYEKLGKILDGRAIVKPGAEFRGERNHLNVKNGTKSMLVSITDTGNGRILGKIHRDWNFTGHPVHDMTGTLNGCVISFTTGPSRQLGNGKDGNWTYTGYIVGTTIVGTFRGVGNGGKSGSGVFQLDKH